MFQATQIDLPTVVRVKAGALDRVGLYLRRCGLDKVAVLQSHELIEPLPQRCRTSLLRTPH
jgi:glycerol-1-phosphate dehydrogenase [NAD(P)+]